jgi:hypothetical protein
LSFSAACKAVYSWEICGAAEAVPFVEVFSVQWQQDRGISADRQRGIFGQIPRITFRRHDSCRRGLANPPKSAQKAQKAPLPMRWIVDIPAGVKSFVRGS